jgi:Domain of unknown function (DUF929)
VGKSDRKQSARERAAEMRAVQQKAEKRRNIFWVGGIVVLVVVLIGVIVAVGLTHKSTTNASGTYQQQPMPASVVNAVVTVPQATLDTVGYGTISNPPSNIGTSVTLTADGKPRILYVGGEFCPYCAGERWAIVQALSRFGTWSGLGSMVSSATDTPASVNTFTFHGASYKSDYVSFTGVEQSSNVVNAAGTGWEPLDTVSAADQAILTKYDSAPYVPKASAGSIPFVSIGGVWLVSGASYDVSVLSGLTWQQISSDMKDPNSDVAKAIDGTANVLAAAVCSITNNAPSNVCSTTAVTTGATKLTTS